METLDTSKVADTSYTSMVADALIDAALAGIHSSYSASTQKELAFMTTFGNRLRISLAKLNEDHADLKARRLVGEDVLEQASGADILQWIENSKQHTLYLQLKILYPNYKKYCEVIGHNPSKADKDRWDTKNPYFDLVYRSRSQISDAYQALMMKDNADRDRTKGGVSSGCYLVANNEDARVVDLALIARVCSGGSTENLEKAHIDGLTGAQVDGIFSSSICILNTAECRTWLKNSLKS